MTLHLVIHRPDAAQDQAIRAALIETVWEVADSHWSAGEEALLVSSDLSPDYLLSHFRRGLARRGHASPGLLLVVPMGQNCAWFGLPQDAADWVKSTI
jgi:hypothetical protein